MKVIIEGKEIDLELTEKQKVVVERALRPQTGWERAVLSNKYFTVEGRGFLNSFREENKIYDDQSYDNVNYFTGSELAINIARAQTLQRKLWRRSAELCDKTEWLNKDNDEYCIYYDYSVHSLAIGVYSCTRHFGQVYFDTKEHAEQVLEEFKDELTWYFTEFKSRMD